MRSGGVTVASPAAETGPSTGLSARLAHFPVMWFAVVMGLAGGSAAGSRAEAVLGLGHTGSAALGWLAMVVFTASSSGFALKALKYPAAVRQELGHPARLPFAATGSVAAVMLALVLLDAAPALSAALWWAGAVVQAGLTVVVLNTLISRADVSVQHVHPGWFIPVVGNLVVPLAGVAHASVHLNWMFFGVGLVYWLALLPIVLGRLLLAGPLPGPLAASVGVMLAPPAVAALAWVRLGGHWTDPAAQILLGVVLVQSALLAVQAPVLARLRFSLGHWAFAFPLAAATSALLAAGQAEAGDAYSLLGFMSFAVLTVLVSGLAARTMLAVWRGEICRAQPS
jgi:tellurite resistance protein